MVPSGSEINRSRVDLNSTNQVVRTFASVSFQKSEDRRSDMRPRVICTITHILRRNVPGRVSWISVHNVLARNILYQLNNGQLGFDRYLKQKLPFVQTSVEHKNVSRRIFFTFVHC